MAECIIVGNNNGSSNHEFTMSNNGTFLYPADVIIPTNVTSLGGGLSGWIL